MGILEVYETDWCVITDTHYKTGTPSSLGPCSKIIINFDTLDSSFSRRNLEAGKIWLKML